MEVTWKIRSKRSLRILTATVVLLGASPSVALDPQEIANAVDASVVRIFVVGPDQLATGTGFVLNREGFVVTNFHVVEPHLDAGWQILVVESGADPENRRAATVVQAFPGEDLAILRVDGLDRPPVMLSEIKEVHSAKGTAVFAIGFPGAADRLGPIQDASLTTGTVSRVFPGSWSEDGPTILIIQHTAPINPGNSGGPLVNGCGQVIGINSQREARIVLGPGGIQLVTDPIQGVFFSSHVSALLAKLGGMDIWHSGSQRTCRTFLGLTTVYLYIYAAAAAFLAIGTIGSLFVFRPRPVVQVVVRCSKIVEDCVNAVERAVSKVRSRASRRGRAPIRPPSRKRGKRTRRHR